MKNIKKMNYELKLSDNMKFKHSIFNASLLKSTHSNTSKNIIRGEYVKSQKKYEIEKIPNTQLINEEFHFLIKWNEYEHFENTWKSQNNFKHCRIFLNDYHRKNLNRMIKRIIY